MAVVFIAQSRFVCSGVMANDEWIVTAGHCTVDPDDEPLKAGDELLIAYNREYVYNGTVAESFTDPDYGFRLSDLFKFKKFAAEDFGMIRLNRSDHEAPLTCEGGFDCKQTPEVPMHSIFIYDWDVPLLDFLSFGLYSRILDFFTFPTSGFFNRQSFHVFGFGAIDSSGKRGLGRLRTTAMTFALTGTALSGRKYWSGFFRDRLFGRDDGRACPGDSGGPWTFRGDGDKFAVTGVTSGGVLCDTWWKPFGFQHAPRFDGKTMGYIQERVESSGGSCSRFEMEGDQLMQCFNP